MKPSMYLKLRLKGDLLDIFKKINMAHLRNFKVSVFVAAVFLIFTASHVAYCEGMNETECNETCSECINDTCTKCNQSYWGQDCQEKCFNCWEDRCEMDTGRCETCTPGQYMANCNMSCHENCRSGIDEVQSCHRDTGVCTRCKIGFSGAFCNYDATFEVFNDFELSIIAVDKRAVEQNGSDSTFLRLCFTLVLVLIPLLFVLLVQVIPNVVTRIRRKGFSPIDNETSSNVGSGEEMSSIRNENYSLLPLESYGNAISVS